MAEGHGRFIDIGVNLDHRRFSEDRDAVVQRAREAGVATMVLTGTSLAGSERALSLANAHGLFSTAGVHPHDASDFESEGGATRLKAMLGQERVVAVGECGLDFDRDFSPRPIQEKVFAEQIQLASDAGLPLFLHERSAHERLCAILDAHPTHPPAVVHCFTGTQAELRAYLERDLYVGITGWICDERRGTHLLDLVREIPAGRLMIETDAPFLTPRSLRPKPKKGRNEPAFLPHIASTIASARGETLEELADHTRRASETFFRLPGADS